jgi:hypothetical protein
MYSPNYTFTSGASKTLAFPQDTLMAGKLSPLH